MATSLGRRRHQDPSFGSRFAGLELDSEDAYPSLNARKRRAHNKNDENVISTSFFSKSMKVCDLMNGPKYVVIKRIDDDETKTLKCVNPFLIQKAIDQQAGDVKSITRTQQGTILVETISKLQAEKMYKMTSLGMGINVNVYEHPTLNTSRGVVSCYDFTFMTDDEILDGLKDQHVVAIKRFTRRVADSQSRINTQSATLTFNLPQLPEKIHMAFQSCTVRPFIPQPLRCFNCQKSGHGSFKCKSTANCGNCAGETHGKGVECDQTPKCINCGGNHPAWSRNCPNYKKEYEIQRIKTIERVTYFEARNQYNARFPHNNTNESIASIMTSQAQTQQAFTFTNKTVSTAQIQPLKQTNTGTIKKTTQKSPRKSHKVQENLTQSSTDNTMDVTSPVKTRSRSNSRTREQKSQLSHTVILPSQSNSPTPPTHEMPKKSQSSTDNTSLFKLPDKM